MRLPQFIKSLIALCDKDSPRYALGGVHVERKENGRAFFTATDAAMLASVSFDDSGSDGCQEWESTLNGQQLAKAMTACKLPAKSLRSMTIDSLVDGRATVSGSATATVDRLDGRFPRWRDVMKQQGDYRWTAVDPSRLKVIAELYSSASKDVTVDVYMSDDPGSPMFFMSTNEHGETTRAVLMPKVGDRKKPEWVHDPDADFAPAPAPECVDDDVLAESIAEEPASAPPAEPVTVPADDEEDSFYLPPVE